MLLCGCRPTVTLTCGTGIFNVNFGEVCDL